MLILGLVMELKECRAFAFSLTPQRKWEFRYPVRLDMILTLSMINRAQLLSQTHGKLTAHLSSIPYNRPGMICGLLSWVIVHLEKT